MKEIAQLTLPNGTTLDNPQGFRTDWHSLGDVISSGYELVIYVAGFLMVIWFFWGVFEYIFAGGAKEKLGKARSRITYAIVGFVIVILAFFIGDFVKDFAKPSDITPTRIEAPQ